MDEDTITYYDKYIQGSRGTVGKCEYKGETCVFKRSNSVDHVMSLEHDVMKLLEKIPHFCRTKGFENNTLFMEKYDSETLGDMIHKKHKCCSAVIGQTMIAIAIAQEMFKFTHYDLHVDNVLMTRTPYDYHTYVLPNGKTYTLKTEGYSPVIIDFGYSFAEGLTPYRSVLEYAHKGFTTYEFDHLADMRIFVTTIVNDMRKYFSTHPFIPLLRSVFGFLPIDRESGWYSEGVFFNALHEIASLTPKRVAPWKSIFSGGCFNSSIELFYNMIDLPLSEPEVKVSDEEYKTVYKTFVKEWLKTEAEHETTTDKRIALIEYLKEKREDPDVKTITNKLREVLFKTQTSNRVIRPLLYDLFSVKSVEDIIDKIVKPCEPANDNVKLFDFSRANNNKII